MDINLIVSPIVGAIIAGCANRMAIKMLFFPTRPIHFIGIRLPFTPGIIPKERIRIAEAIGSAAGKHILNEEGIINAVNSPEIQQNIRQTIRLFLSGLGKFEGTVENLLSRIVPGNMDDFSCKVKSIVSNIIISVLRSESSGRKIEQLVSHIIDHLLEKEIDTLAAQNNYAEFIENISAFISDALYSPISIELIEEASDVVIQSLLSNDTVLSSILTEEQRASILDFIEIHSPKLCSLLEKYLQDPYIRAKLNDYIDDAIKRSFIGSLVLKFVDSGKIYSYVYTEISKFISSAAGQREVSRILRHFTGNIMTYKISDIFSKLSINENRFFVEMAVEAAFRTALTRQNIQLFIEKIANYFSNLQNKKIHDILMSINEDLVDTIKSGLTNVVKKSLMGSWAQEIVFSSVSFQIDELLKRNASDLININNEEKLQSLESSILDFIISLITSHAGRILEIADISKIVTDRLNSFDIKEMEEILLGVVKKDLWALTFLEASLGFVIGFLSPLVVYLYEYLF